MATKYKRCSIDGCEHITKSKDFCATHLYRYKKHGDPLKLSHPKGAGLHWLMEVAMHYDGDDCLMWPFTTRSYGIVNYNGRKVRPSRLICTLTIGPPPEPRYEAAHSCGRGHEGCVNPKHLRWATPSENQHDRVAHGTSNRGQRGKVTAKDVIWIRSVAGKVPQKEIAAKFGMDQSSVSNIITGKNWAWLQTRNDS